MANELPFLWGAGDRGWKASLDWYIKSADPAIKILEGEYVDHRTNGPIPHLPKPARDPGEGMEWVWDTKLNDGEGAWHSMRNKKGA
jgi:hypothetical protein